MVEQSKGNWHKWITGLALPVAVTVSGYWIAAANRSHDDNVAESNRKHDDQVRAAQAETDAWRQDAEYVKLLGSSDAREREFAKAIISALRQDKRFPAGLEIAVNALGNWRPGDPTTLAAAGTAPSAQAGSVAHTGPIPVFIQYARAQQLCDVEKLAQTLRGMGYATPASELVNDAPDRTSVRFFSDASKGDAEKVSSAVAGLGYKSRVANFQGQSTVQLRPIEVWLGKLDNPHVLATESGKPLTTEAGDYLLDANCEPLTIGKSPLR